MKNIKITSIICLVAFFAIFGCEDVIDVEPQDRVTEVAVYDDIDQVEALVYPMYNSTEGWAIRRNEFWGQRVNLEGASFEAKFNFKDFNTIYQLRNGGWSKSNVGLAFAVKWQNYWSYVQATNEFLSKIDDSPAYAADPDKAEVLKAEVRFLRANLYTKLIKYFGGVPLLTEPAKISDSFDYTRNSYQECVEFIVAELDAAAAILPLTRSASEFGRATRTAALAVKSRTLLYAASDLHDPNLLPQTTNTELYSYPVATKWEDAENAAKAVIDIVGEDVLIQVADAQAYQALFLSPNNNIIFARPYAAGLYEVGTGGFNAANSLPDQAQSPNGYGGWGLCSPTLNFTLEFNFDDGTSTGGITPADPNANREMRYYANLNFQGADFRGRPINYALSDTIPGQTEPAFPHGLDSPQGGGNKLHASKTGYNIRKFQDESLSATNGISADRPYILYRVAEIYLNYAEALAEQGKDGLASTYLSRVSVRALQPAINLTGDALKEAIKRERRVELCFEGHNFFDERRWLNEDNLGFDIKGLKWKVDTSGVLSFEEYSLFPDPALGRVWLDKLYYLPIPEGDSEIVPTLIQNFGYTE
ncbi:RagB/SusD family nutrient uptake outer membrane protein [Flavivirga rizhaonensis]|uniref:RagB/SusD family nutrient uptake outer membrane protein n=1 Tax=Flavivirga rizhaonensis TaxID=2559571 RepID=A0A4S1DTP2_9FLAO|nr:RagB/SusD family nutrient uptake outer membrane protein [Flavivirga rizhaonensis]TGV00778.1 RagB/SusD family nutrient uptake outer membrane protein [Flavivirga rizhaonensis]